MQVQKIFNANVYVNGTNSLVGRAGEFTLPELVFAQDEVTALGMFGKLEVPTGLEPLAGKIKWAGYYADQQELGANPFLAHNLQLRGNVQVFDASGLAAEQPFVAEVKVKFKKSPLGVFVPMTSPEIEQEFSCTYVKTRLNGEEVVEIDVMANVYKVKGVDILAAYRKNLGLEG